MAKQGVPSGRGFLNLAHSAVQQKKPGAWFLDASSRLGPENSAEEIFSCRDRGGQQSWVGVECGTVSITAADLQYPQHGRSFRSVIDDEDGDGDGDELFYICFVWW